MDEYGVNQASGLLPSCPSTIKDRGWRYIGCCHAASMESLSYAVRDTRFPANLDSSDCKYWTLNLDGTRSCPSATPKLPLRPVVLKQTDLLTSQSVMKRMNQSEQLPKFEKMEAKNAKLRSLLRVFRQPAGTVSKICGAIALSLGVGAHELIWLSRMALHVSWLLMSRRMRRPTEDQSFCYPFGWLAGIS
jgi:hypothetical protein